MARASTVTALSLQGFARLLGIAPVHFAGAQGSTYWPVSGACRDVWPQYNWQTREDLVSREELAQAIHDAERDIRAVLGYDVAPTWHAQEVQMWPHPVRGRLHHPAQIKLNWGKVIASGPRAVTLIDADAAVTRSDPDGDGWNERATVTVSTSVTEPREIKLYTAGKEGDPAWEIRPLRSVTIAEGTATIVFDSWLAIDPDLWEWIPSSEGWDPIDIEAPSAYVTTVDVYREYTDSTATAATFYWGAGNQRSLLSLALCPSCGGAGCAVCGLTSADGCFSVLDSEWGVVLPFPATYDADSAAWSYAAPGSCGVPDQVKFYYRAGNLSAAYLRGQTLDPLDPHLAQAIVWLALARLVRPVCNCSNVLTTVRFLQSNAAVIRSGEAVTAHFEDEEIFSNPFGTKVGEVRAWQRVKHLVRESDAVGGAL